MQSPGLLLDIKTWLCRQCVARAVSFKQLSLVSFSRMGCMCVCRGGLIKDPISVEKSNQDVSKFRTCNSMWLDSPAHPKQLPKK